MLTLLLDFVRFYKPFIFIVRNKKIPCCESGLCILFPPPFREAAIRASIILSISKLRPSGQLIAIGLIFSSRQCIAMTLKENMRLLWEQHVYWTRMTIISIANDLPDKDATTKRLLRNAKDFENLFRCFYGPKLAREFGNLITAHLVIAAELVTAALTGNTKATANAEKRWYANADEFVAFLTHINPSFSDETLREMWYEHLALTKAEAAAMLRGNYTKSITLFDQIEQEALMMADYLTCGITRQFPNKF